jgi:RNA polymerase sigma-70 factor, ECF subfamily
MQSEEKQKLFLSLYEPQAEKLERFCLNLTRNREDGRELISETVCAAYHGFENVRDKKAFLSFLFTIAHRLFFKNKEKFRRNVYQDPREFGEILSGDISPDKQYDIKILYKALDKLDEKVREAIILAEIFGFPHSDIAKVQTTTIANIKVRIHRGKNKLKKILARDINVINEEVSENA